MITDNFAYRVIFDGQFAPGLDRATVAARLRKRLGLSLEQTRSLLVCRSCVIKQDLSFSRAQAIVDTLRKAGLICHAESTGPRADPLFVGAQPLHEYFAGIFSVHTAVPHPAVDQEVRQRATQRLQRLEQCHYHLRQFLPDINEIQRDYERSVNRRSELAGVLVLTDYGITVSPGQHRLRNNDPDKIETLFDDVELLSDRLTLRCQDIYDVACERLGIILSFFVDGTHELHEDDRALLDSLIEAWESVARTDFNVRDIIREEKILEIILNRERDGREDLYTLLHNPGLRAHAMIQRVQSVSSKTPYPFADANQHYMIDQWIERSGAIPRRGSDIREFIGPVNTFTRIYPGFMRTLFSELSRFASRIENQLRTEGVKVKEAPAPVEPDGFDLVVTDVDEDPGYADLYGKQDT